MMAKETQYTLVLRAGYVPVEEYAAGKGNRLAVSETLHTGRLTHLDDRYLLEVYDQADGEYIALNTGDMFITRREALDFFIAYTGS